MAAAEDLVEESYLAGDSLGSGAQQEPEDGDRTLLDIVARQQVLLENIVICDHMLVQLHRLRQSLADKGNVEAANNLFDQAKSVDLPELHSDFQHEP